MGYYISTMKAIEQLRATAAKIGVTLDVTNYSIHCDAPSGYVWLANGLPSLHIQYATNSQSWLVKAITMELPNLKMGLSKVTDEKQLSEHRWNLGDDTWAAPSNAPDKLEWPN